MWRPCAARNWKDKTGYTYGLHGTPTTFLLEERLCALEGGLQCLLVPSGLAAIANGGTGACSRTGDEVLIPDNAYGPNKALAEGELAAWGITHQLYDAMDPADLAAKISARTRLVWLEAPGSVTMEFPDLPRTGARVPRPRRARPRWTTPGAPAWPSSRLTWAATAPGAWAWTSPCMP